MIESVTVLLQKRPLHKYSLSLNINYSTSNKYQVTLRNIQIQESKIVYLCLDDRGAKICD
jgi:hypothetical protein